MDYNEEDFLMLSGIQHFVFCRRQWALIHIEQQWAENLRTIEGELLHKKAHTTMSPEKRKGTMITRSMAVHSRTLGISGVCDIVEFKRSEKGITLPKHRGCFEVYPVEYKRGKPKEDHCDSLQLTAQAMCLEEMLCCDIPSGALYYGEIKHRQIIDFDASLRKEVCETFEEMHQIYNRKYMPKVKMTKACNACSLKEECLPKLSKASSASHYMKVHIEEG